MLHLLGLVETRQIRPVASSGDGFAGNFRLAADDGGYAGGGRAYAAYGGIYIIASLCWLWVAEGARPDRWDMTGAAVALAGSAIILAGPR